MINNGMNITFDLESMELIYNQESFGPITEKRRLDDVRATLRDPQAKGPKILYSIAMDVGLKKDQEKLVRHNLLYGACLYNKGQVGEEPVRSQGHIHFQSPSCNCSTGELYEIWHGKAIVFMQEKADDHPGRVFAVEGVEGDVILVPPGWAHYTVNADIIPSSTILKLTLSPTPTINKSKSYVNIHGNTRSSILIIRNRCMNSFKMTPADLILFPIQI
jgi:glucose-6-phosphate isomerase